eukprot:gene31054-38382_t
MPSVQPTAAPTLSPSKLPSALPSVCPSFLPSTQPTTAPPSIKPSTSPSVAPSTSPTALPTYLQPLDTQEVVPLLSRVMRHLSTNESTNFLANNNAADILPSKKPSAQPSDQPSSRPTVMLPGHTRAPSAPTAMQWTTILSSTQGALRDSSSDDVAHQTMYSELDVVGNTPYSLYGSCSSWSSMVSGDLYPSSFLYQATSIAMTVVDSLSSSSEVRICNEQLPVNQVMSYFRAYSSGNLTVSCENHKWSLKYCSSSEAALCVDCADPCSKTSHCSSRNNTTVSNPFAISPCVSRGCNTSTEFPSSAVCILTVAFKEFEAAPVMTPLNVTVTKTAVTVTSRLSSKGSMYCAVYQNSAPGSLSEILLQNHVAAISSKNVSTVTIAGLSAVNNYSVYCLAISPSNVMTPLSTVLTSVRVVPTACCKIVNVQVSSVNIVAGQTAPNFASIVLNSVPSSPLQVSVKVVSAITGVEVLFAAIPSVLTFTSNGVLSRYVSLASLSVGSYKIVATLSGLSIKEFEIVYGGDITTSGQNFTVLSSTAPVPAPVMKSAIFASNGSYIAISFDSKTDQGNTSTVFTCSQLFNFTCAEISICKWADASTSVNALVATSDRCAVPSSLTLLSSAVINAKCTAVS